MEQAFEKTIKVAPAKLKVLSRKSDLQGWAQTLGHLGAIAICSWLLYQSWGSLWSIPVFAVQGILINCLYAGVHELSHNTVFKSKKLNEYVGRLFTFILLMGRDQDKFEHFQHHRYTQDVERDAEIVGGDPFNLLTYLLYMSGITYWSGRVSEVVNLAFGRTHKWPWLSEVQFRSVHKEARLMLVGYSLILAISVFFGSWAAVIYWLVPMLSMKWFHNLQNTVEHTGMPHETDILVNTRTVKANRLMRRLFWNMPYHTAHHSYPMIPFYQLPELHREIETGLGYELPKVSHFAFQKHMIKKLIKEGTSKYTGQDITAY